MTPHPPLAEILTDPGRNGLYRLAPHLSPAQGDSWIVIRGDALTDKTAILAEMGRALALPDYYGHNWDALEECLHDLEGESGLALLIDEAGIPEAADPDAWANLLDILTVAAEDWQAVDRPFAVFLRGGHAAYPLISA